MTSRTSIWIALTTTMAAGACGSNETTGRNVTLHTRLTADIRAGHQVTTATGWTITLDQALIATGPFYFYEGEAAVTQAPRRPRWRRWLADAIAPEATAWAHPGHYIPGRAMGQMTMGSSADLLAGAVAFPDATEVTGTVRSGTFSFAPPSAGPAVAALQGHVALARGTASKDGKTVHFLLTADMPDIARTAKDGLITGCAFTETDIEAAGVVTATVKPGIWFELVDFSTLDPGAADAPTTPDPSSTAHIAFALGLTQLSAYTFTYTQEMP